MNYGKHGGNNGGCFSPLSGFPISYALYLSLEKFKRSPTVCLKGFKWHITYVLVTLTAFNVIAFNIKEVRLDLNKLY